MSTRRKTNRKTSSLLTKIDEHITNPLNLDSRAKHFYPTGASCEGVDGELRGSCNRAVAFDYLSVGKSNPYTAETMYTFGVGKHIELMLVDWFKEMGIFAGHNIKFYNPFYHLSGELDMVCREAPGSDVLFGVECKTSYGDYFKMAQITGRAGIPAAPKDEHIMQVMLYLDNFPSLKYFVLVYIGRDKFDRTEYTIRLKDVDGDLYPEITNIEGKSRVDMDFSLARIYNRYKSLAGYLKSKSLPPRDYRPVMTQDEMDRDFEAGKVSKAQMKKFAEGEILTADWRCRYCSHKTLCRNMPEGTVKNFLERLNKGEWDTVEQVEAIKS
jgi:DNA-directed RNA polymerase subunit RPC12/RpoP